jgi:hypothetical protein
MEKKDFYLESKTRDQLVFSDGKDINTAILILSFLMFILGGFLYYLLSRRHMITMNLVNTRQGTHIELYGSTPFSNTVSEEFIEMIQTFDISSQSKMHLLQEIKCPRCGSSLDIKGLERFVECSFCGSNISILEVRKR